MQEFFCCCFFGVYSIFLVFRVGFNAVVGWCGIGLGFSVNAEQFTEHQALLLAIFILVERQRTLAARSACFHTKRLFVAVYDGIDHGRRRHFIQTHTQ